MSDAHISSEELAAFAAGSLDTHEAKRVVDHLETCPRCSEAFRSGVRVLGAVGDELPGHSFPDEVLDQARRAGAEPYPTRPKARRRLRTVVPAAAAVAVIVALLIWTQRMGGPSSMGLAAFPVIEDAAGAAASYSMLVIPGAEERMTNGSVPQRSGAPAPTPELKAALAQLIKSRQDQSLEAESAYALIAGQLAAGGYRLANDLVSDAERRFGERAEYSAARGIALFHLDHLPEALDAFRSASVLEPNRPVNQYNLAVVLNELGQVEESRRLAARVASAAAGTPLGERAQALHSSM